MNVFSSLMLASFSGKADCVKLLTEYGAQYDLTDKGGTLALHWAIDGSSLELIDFMLQHMGEQQEDTNAVNCLDNNGWTPLIRVG